MRVVAAKSQASLDSADRTATPVSAPRCGGTPRTLPAPAASAVGQADHSAPSAPNRTPSPRRREPCAILALVRGPALECAPAPPELALGPAALLVVVARSSTRVPLVLGPQEPPVPSQAGQIGPTEQVRDRVGGERAGAQRL